MKKNKFQRQYKVKKGKWFVAVRGSYLPVSSNGWFSYIPFVAYLIITPVLSFSYTSKAWLAMLYAAILWAIGAVVMTYFAKTKS